MSEPTILICGSGTRAAALARLLAQGARVRTAPLPAARLTTAAASAASTRRIERAWRALGTVEAVVICCNLSTGPRRRNPGLTSWRAGLGATLRASYVVARAAGLALARQGRGTLLIVNEAPAGRAAVAAVAAEGLSCLSDALARALGRGVRVAEVSSGDGRGGSPALARAIRAALGGAPAEPLPNVRSGAGSRG